MALRYKPESRGFDSRGCHWNFSLTLSFRPHFGPGVDTASNRSEYQECFLGVKAAGAWGWQPYHLQVPIVLKSGSLNLLEPSGPVQACNGIALPLPFICVWYFRLSQTVISQMTVWLLHNWVQEMQLPEVKYGFHLLAVLLSVHTPIDCNPIIQ